MKNKILITGVGGYIGSVAAYLFLQNGYQVVGLDNFSTGYRQPLELLQKKFGQEKFRFYQVDLRDNPFTIRNQSQLNQDDSGCLPLDSIFAREIKSDNFPPFDAVVHYAASCIVDESMKNPEKYFENNVCGSQNLLKTMMKYGVNKIVFSSTCAVYGEAKYVPVDEKHPTNPTNPYGESKRMIEKIIEWYGELKEIDYCILRYFNVCGASDDGLIGDSKKPSTLLVQNVVRGLLGIDKFYLTCPEVETPDRTPIRDYINVVDLNEAHLKAVEKLLSLKVRKFGEIINLGTGTGNSVLEIVQKAEKIMGKKINLEKTTPRQGEYAKMIASIEKAKKVLNWQPRRTIKESIESLVKWYQIHPQGWEK